MSNYHTRLIDSSALSTELRDRLMDLTENDPWVSPVNVDDIDGAVEQMEAAFGAMIGRYDSSDSDHWYIEDEDRQAIS